MLVRRMGWLVLLLGCGALWCPGGARAEAALDARQVAEKLQQVYEGTRDFKAAFLQEYTSVALGRRKASSGFVYVKKPGMMRWDYKEPAPKTFVADGKALYVYDPELEQVMVDRSFSGSELSTAVTFLWGKGDLLAEFEVAFSQRAELQGGQVYVLELKPRKAARFRRLWFAVEKDTFRVLRTLVEDPGGNLNRITFSKMATNVGLEDAAFAFEIPKGVEVIEAPGAGN
ncbi:MAG TPA: outer membrane lipoprotein carrier protein LolA [Myxococcota bacterium]|nr:outer membrane lipoprotein carrier protein LolA [Myxococcota bacterium]HRY96767.1 outer membrane lipoprotein carrier protein LolA [Myxococcota bacterium]HSA21544.1 outer membrane lipoprotein carrier protein LolA [Myxococcota bacterium]